MSYFKAFLIARVPDPEGVGTLADWVPLLVGTAALADLEVLRRLDSGHKLDILEEAASKVVSSLEEPRMAVNLAAVSSIPVLELQRVPNLADFGFERIHSLHGVRLAWRSCG